MSYFRDQIAIVTGAGSGIGRSLSHELARRGAVVVISDVSAKRIEEVGAEISTSGGKVTALSLDVTDYDAVKKMVDDTVAEHGRLDLIFNNAGIAVGGEARDVDIDDWRAVLDVNLMGVVHGVTSAYPIMVKQGCGHIVNTSSIEGLIPFPVTSSYVASKYAVLGMSNALRVEGADLGVKVSAVCPGYVKTAIFEESKMVKIERKELIDQLSDRIGVTPDECARIILRGVERNKAIIPVTALAWVLWIIARISPNLMMGIMRRVVKRGREGGIRIEDD